MAASALISLSSFYEHFMHIKLMEIDKWRYQVRQIDFLIVAKDI